MARHYWTPTQKEALLDTHPMAKRKALLDTHPMAVRSSLRWRITGIELRFRRLCRVNASVTIYPWDIQDHT